MSDLKAHDSVTDPTPELAADRDLARRVVANEPRAVHRYLWEIGTPIMKHIERSITHRDISAEYYIFLSAPFDPEAALPGWHPVRLYRGTDCRLSSYTATIACRHFWKIAAKEKKNEKNASPLLDFVDYETLLKCETPEEGSDDTRSEAMRRAFRTLPERYRRVLECLVIEKMPALDAWPLLEGYINPRPKDGLTSREVKQNWTLKQRQDALSLVKGYALKALRHRFDSLKKAEQ